MDRAARIAALFREALDLEPKAREAFVIERSGGDPTVAAELRALLAEVDGRPSPLDRDPAQRLGLGASSSAVPARVGPFRLVRPLGRGGMGEVWLAERVDGGFEQLVALKWVEPARLGTDGLERFERERALLAAVDHPSIARVVDGGRIDGTPWFAMEYVDGVPIDRHVIEARLDLGSTIDLMRAVVEAVQHLHRHLIVHRDLKPSNVLVDRDGRPRLIDLGIAKSLADETRLTGRLAPMSVAYAAPEQVAGEAITIATDVYGLGALLHELLSGRSPHAAAESSLPRLVDAIARGTPTLPSVALATNPSARPWRPVQLEGDLDLIVATCLKREPERRYGSAAALGEDLRRWRERLPISARRDRPIYRARRFVERHPVGVGFAIVAVVGMLATTAYAIGQARRAESAAIEAARERDRAREEARRQEVLREHFAAVIGRVVGDGEPVTPDRLMDLVADDGLTLAAHDPATHRALVLALADALAIRADLRRLARLAEGAAHRFVDAPAHEQAVFHKHRALAGLRLGDDALAADGLAKAQAALERGGLERTMLAAEVLGFRAQRARAAGDFETAVRLSESAAAIARESPEGSALDRGTVLANHGVTLMHAGFPERALVAIDEAEAIWEAGGVAGNANAASTRAVRANALLASGRPADALALFERIEAERPPGDPAPAQAARALGRARALAWLARTAEADAAALDAVERMCSILGEDSGDCRRMRAGRIEVLALTGEREAARQALALDPTLPASASALPAVALLHDSSEDVRAALAEVLAGAPDADRALRRQIGRIALLAAHRARRSGARREASSLLSLAETALTGLDIEGGFERPWLDCERAQAHAETPPPEAMTALEALGMTWSAR